MPEQIQNHTESGEKSVDEAIKKVSKFKTAKKIPQAQAGYAPRPESRINLVSNSRYSTAASSRLLSPLDAERRRARLYGSTDNSALRKKRRPSRRLSLKAAPIVPTAPRDPVTIKRNWAAAQIKAHIEALDLPLAAAALLMCVLGIISVYSASYTYSTIKFVFVQSFACLLGFSLMVLISVADYRQFITKYRVILALNAAILIFTFIFGSSVTDSTNANWIDLGFIKVQPSEFSKLMFIYSFAVHLSYVRDKLNKLSTFFTLVIHACLIFGLLLLQKDLGSLTIFLMIFIAMCFAAGLSIWYYLAGAAFVTAMLPVLWKRLSTYQRDRIMMCFDSSIDAAGTGIRYQQLRSQTAIGNGGIFGTGYLNGTVTQSESGPLPAKHTDMIFATVCEEWGLIGAVIILSATAFLIYRIIRLALKCENPVGKYICVGVSVMLMTQVAENVGMCLGIMPVIGITYPFLSYGGSSVLSAFMAIGMVLSVGAHREKTFFEQDIL